MLRRYRFAVLVLALGALGLALMASSCGGSSAAAVTLGVEVAGLPSTAQATASALRVTSAQTTQTEPAAGITGESAAPVQPAGAAATVSVAPAATTQPTGAAATVSVAPATTENPDQTGDVRSAAAPAFQSSIRPISAALQVRMLMSGSWKKGDPITFSELRLVKVTYWGFDDQAHVGSLVVHVQWAAKLSTVFQKLYEARFPIRSMNLIDGYGASDGRSMAADNTSSYNGRFRGGSNSVWSMHAYGLAIDINPVENPWVYSGGFSPAAGKPYVNRSQNAKGMIHAGDVVVKAFASIGWTWGGSWKSSKDYQHFSSNGE
ncbi:MAG: M15 family metallopeptidase [Actinobacteria bacterium]|nr:M15 family metallopeptidase [Actinomycetota bacterium]